MRDHKPGDKVFGTLLLAMMIGLAAVQSAEAQEKLVVSYPASAGTHGPLWAAKDLGIFAKYGLSVDTVMIAGSARGIQALLANSTQIIQGDPASPILAASRGAEIAIIAQPHTVITARRSFIKQNPDIIKRYVQAYSEAIFLFKTDASKGIAVYSKRLRQRDPKVIQQSYDYYAPRFSFPPKPNPVALRTVLDLVSQHAPEARKQVDVGQFLDDSAIRALEKEGFFKKLADARVNQ
jgi:ABC-type nitrate/sulfonate/bicarbonate transport system substrate-binding protein